MAQQSTEASPIVKMALVGIIGIGLFYGAQSLETVAHRINDLPVEGTNINSKDPLVAPKSKAPAVNAIHPLIVESNIKVAGEPMPTGGATSFEKLFEDTNAVSAQVFPKFDFRSLKDNLTVQALMDNGAIINKKFYAPGDKITVLGYQVRDTDPVQYPVLKSIGKTYVVISNGARRNPVTFKVALR